MDLPETEGYATLAADLRRPGASSRAEIDRPSAACCE